jgi:16S rRNA G966 N2-methylase RsmD
MGTGHRSGRVPTHDRNYLLGEDKRNDLLALWEIQRYGVDSFGDPDYVSIYGLKPNEWYARGVRLLARTAVECTRDRLADLIGGDIANLAGAAPIVSGSVVVDPFAGSGNTLYWIKRHLSTSWCLAFELDNAVFETTRRNLSILNLEITLLHQDHEAGLAALSIPEDQLLVVFVAPPWGDALSETSGLDLRRTQPPVSDVVNLIATTFPTHKTLVATQVHETTDSDSLTDATSHFDWSTLKTYGINAPGKNSGLLLGTNGWTP